MQQAIAAYNARDLARADQVCRLVLKAKPDYFDALNLAGVIAAQSERLAEAADLLGRALAAQPGQAETHCNLGVIQQKLGRLEAAIASFDRATALRPAYAEAHLNRGNVLHSLGRREAALESYDRALAARPGYAQAQVNRGNVLQELQRLVEAIESFDRALALQPDNAQAHFNRGNALQALERTDEALQSYDHALALAPGHADAWKARGNALKELLKVEAAVDSYDRAIAARPDDLEALCNRGLALHELRRLDEAIACYDRIIAKDPQFAGAHWNKAHTLLMRGDLPQAWPLFEWRWRNAQVAARQRDFAQPLWRGGADALVGKTILLHSEQGLGDTIQFCRYAPLVAALGARVVLEVQTPLVRLLQTSMEALHVVPRGSALPPFDLHCPLMSLPLAFGTALDTIPAPQRYLGADAARSAAWREKIGKGGRPRVGLVWAGGAGRDRPGSWTFRRRDIPLAALAALPREPLTYYSLQKGEAAEAELKAALGAGWRGPGIVDFGAELADFAETAALIDALDLVISVDTAVAHLAGALGKPVWILNRYDGCWRWQLERDDSPWYPSARLYRQERRGDWSDVIARVAGDLRAWAADRSG